MYIGFVIVFYFNPLALFFLSLCFPFLILWNWSNMGSLEKLCLSSLFPLKYWIQFMVNSMECLMMFEKIKLVMRWYSSNTWNESISMHLTFHWGWSSSKFGFGVRCMFLLWGVFFSWFEKCFEWWRGMQYITLLSHLFFFLFLLTMTDSIVNWQYYVNIVWWLCGI
jgi:hypothetical protein